MLISFCDSNLLLLWEHTNRQFIHELGSAYCLRQL